MINSTRDIHVMYINLESRPDRNDRTKFELSQIGFKSPLRFNAIQRDNGAIGCTMSHIKCIEHAKRMGWSNVMVCEDDICFTNPELFRDRLGHFLTNHKTDWDVLLIAGIVIAPVINNPDGLCMQVSHCQTTTGYIVKSHYFDTLLENYRTGLLNLIRTPEMHSKYAIDMFWLQLQKTHRWLMLTPMTVVQCPNFSNIENRQTNYAGHMLAVKPEKCV